MAKGKRRREDEERGDSRPKIRAYEARENALFWKKQCLDAHQGTSDYPAEYARRKLHTAVLSYFDILAQVRNQRPEWKRDDEEEYWENVELFAHNGKKVKGLQSLRNWQFKSQRQAVAKGNFAKPQQVSVKTQPVRLTIHQASKALDVLDEAAAEVGLKWAVPQDEKTDMIRDFDQSGSEPSGEYYSGDSPGTPDL